MTKYVWTLRSPRRKLIGPPLNEPIRKFGTNIEAKETHWRGWRIDVTIEFPLNSHKIYFHYVSATVNCTCRLRGRTCVLSFSLQAGLLLRYMWLMREFVSWVHPRWAEWAPGSMFGWWNMSDPRQRQENWSILLSSIRKYTVAFIWVQSN